MAKMNKIHQGQPMQMMQIKKYLLIINIIAVLILISSCLVYGQDAFTARVLTIEGQVEISRQAAGQAAMQPIAFKAEDTLRAGDRITTGKNGRLVLGLSDGSQAVIAPKTSVVIEDLSQSPRTLFNIIKGKTRIHIEKLGGRPNPYKVNTPTAVIAVRGTIFDVMVDDTETEVFLHEGEVAVVNRRLPDRLTILTAGQMTRVNFQRPPSQPDAFKAGRNDGTFKSRETVRPAGAENGRIANGGTRPETSQKRPDAAVGARPDLGRGGAFPGAGPGASPGASPGIRRPASSPASTSRPGGRP